MPQQRTFGEGGDTGGLVIDWNLRTSLEGLYCAGDQIFAGNYHHHAAVTGRYAGRKAAEYAIMADEPILHRIQVEEEKTRIYTPIKRNEGIEWKELNAGICRVMQNYCGDPKNGELFKIGLMWLDDIEKNVASCSYASDPHKLGRTLDVLDLLTCGQVIIHACDARKASSDVLDFHRLDYPEIDPPEWKKWLTIKMETGEIKHDSMPIDFWGDLRRV